MVGVGTKFLIPIRWLNSFLHYFSTHFPSQLITTAHPSMTMAISTGFLSGLMHINKQIKCLFNCLKPPYTFKSFWGTTYHRWTTPPATRLTSFSTQPIMLKVDIVHLLLNHGTQCSFQRRCKEILHFQEIHISCFSIPSAPSDMQKPWLRLDIILTKLWKKIMFHRHPIIKTFCPILWYHLPLLLQGAKIIEHKRPKHVN